MLKHRKSRKEELSAEDLLAEIHDDPTIRSRSILSILSEPAKPTGGFKTTEGLAPPVAANPSVAPSPTVGFTPPDRPVPPVGLRSTVIAKHVRPIRLVQDALTATAFLVYDRMYGAANGLGVKICAMGYSEIARDTGRHKDLVRDIIADLKSKGIVREIDKYDADTRKPKTYEVLSFGSVLQLWREAGICYVTKARRPIFCDSQGNELSFVPTVGLSPTAGSVATMTTGVLKPTVVPKSTGTVGAALTGTVGPKPTLLETVETKKDNTSAADLQELRSGLAEQIGWIDEDAARRLLEGCQSRAGKTVSTAQILGVVASKLSAARKARNPVGLLIDAVPKAFPLPDLPTERLYPDEEPNDQAYWEGILTNENAPEGLKQQAKHLLGL